MSIRQVIDNRFEIRDLERDLLGRGGMGDVYRGLDSHTGQIVAIKALKPETVASDPDVVARFVREGEALRQLNHPNIVKMVDAVEEDGRHYLVIEYVGGGSLRDLLDQQRPGIPMPGLPIPRVVEIALEVADALTRAHHLGIIHRDLKPSNVLLAEDGTPRLTDFGIAHLAGQPGLTETGLVMGTVGYLSPEACNGETLDVRADIWAFGVMLYEMLAGERPFTGETLIATFAAILTQPVPDLSQRCPNVPDALADLVYRMLEKDRHQRIPSVRLVGAELEAILAGVSGPPPGLSVVEGSAVSYRPLPMTSRFATPTPPAEAPKHNLPAQTTPFVGRESELESLARLLDDPGVRLITILSPGGMGKTRLALEAAAAQLGCFADGVFFVSLAPLRSPENILPTVAEAVNVQFYPGGEPKQQLLGYFRQRQTLLVMDNFEHLLDGAGIVTEILHAAPRVQVLATSRQKLNLSGETAFIIAGMDFPDWETSADALEYSAVQLFMQSARRARPAFELEAGDLRYVSRVCRLVQGMPLGILLAAAWVDMISLQEIATEISQSLDFLETDLRDVPERQRSIRGVFESSWNRLTDAEREAFTKLSVFRGGFTREAAQQVTGVGLRTLMALTNKSLLHRRPAGRYEIHELLRQYAGDKLGETPTGEKKILDLHCAYYAEFLHRRETDLWKGYLREALLEIDNIRAAWRWATLHRKVAEIHKCLHCLCSLYQGPGLLQEGESVYAKAIDALRARQAEELNEERDAALGVALVMQGFFSAYLGHVDKGQELLQEGLSLLRRLGARRELAFGYGLAVAAGTLESLSDARQLLEESLTISRELDNYPAIPWALWLLGRIALLQGAHREAEQYCREALGVSRRIDDRSDAAYALVFLGHTVYERGEYARARQCYEESLTLHKEIGDQLAMGRLYSHLGDVALAMHDYEEAGERHRQALARYRDVGVYWKEEPVVIGGCWGVPVSLQTLGDIALAMGNHREAKEYYRQALEMATTKPYGELRLHVLLGPARLLARDGDVERAVELAALALHDPASIEETKGKAQVLLDELQAELPPAVFVAAQERGRARDLDATVAELLAELEE